MNERENITYKQGMGKQEFSNAFKAVVFPVVTFCLGLFVISNFAGFGRNLICPLSGVMWFIGFFVALLMPSQRQEVLKQTLSMCCIYFVALFGLKMMIGIVSGVSSEMIAASYDQAIPTATGNAIPGALQSMLWFVAVLVPLSFIAMQARRLMQFKKNQSIHKAFGRVRGYRDGGNEHDRPF